MWIRQVIRFEHFNSCNVFIVLTACVSAKKIYTNTRSCTIKPATKIVAFSKQQRTAIESPKHIIGQLLSLPTVANQTQYQCQNARIVLQKDLLEFRFSPGRTPFRVLNFSFNYNLMAYLVF